MYYNIKPLAQEAQDLGLFPPITSVESSLIPLSIVPTSIPMIFSPMSLPTSHPSYHNVPFTYSTPLPIIVPSVPLIVSCIPIASYSSPSVYNVSITPNSHD